MKMKTMSYAEIKALREIKENNYIIVEEEDKTYLEDENGNFVRPFSDHLKDFFSLSGYTKKRKTQEKLSSWAICTEKCAWLYD